jgi:hypothetical protein
MSHRIYVASSWRNSHQPSVVMALLERGHRVYDFRHPVEGNDGFSWAKVDPHWEVWDYSAYTKALSHPLCEQGFALDYSSMALCDSCVLVLPSGRSSHLEAGYFVGAGKTLVVYMPEMMEPDMMYKMADQITNNLADTVTFFES